VGTSSLQRKVRDDNHPGEAAKDIFVAADGPSPISPRKKIASASEGHRRLGVGTSQPQRLKTLFGCSILTLVCCYVDCEENRSPEEAAARRIGKTGSPREVALSFRLGKATSGQGLVPCIVCHGTGSTCATEEDQHEAPLDRRGGRCRARILWAGRRAASQSFGRKRYGYAGSKPRRARIDAV